MYQVLDSRGEYQLVVGQEKQLWNVEEVVNSSKVKEAPKKDDAGAERKEGGGGEKKAVPVDDAGSQSQKPAAVEKAPEKPSNVPVDKKAVVEISSSKKIVRVERVREWMAEVNDAVQMAESGHTPRPSKKHGIFAAFQLMRRTNEIASEKEKKAQQLSKPKKEKKAYIEEDDEDEPKRRGRERERRR